MNFCLYTVYGFGSNEGAGTGTLVFPVQEPIKQAVFCNTT